MKILPLLLPVVVLAVFATVMLSSRFGPAWDRTGSDPSDDSPIGFESFVDEVGVDVSAMSTELRRDRIISDRKPSLPLCALSFKRMPGLEAESPLDALARDEGFAVPDTQEASFPSAN